MRHWIRNFIYFGVIFLLLAQVFPPAQTNPPIDPANTIHARVSMEPMVTAALTRACNDCHSNSTVWPWYSRVAPVSWLVVNDVRRGRRALNFSEWKSLDAQKQQEMLPEICKEVTDREMPIEEYVLLHPNAKLTSEEVRSICTWSHSSHLQGLQTVANR